MRKVIKFIKKPYGIIPYLGARGCFKIIKDEKYLKISHRFYHGEKLNLDAPTTFNQKLQWLKLNDRNPLYTQLTDKYEVKQIVENIIGKEYVIKTLGVWDSYKSIDFNNLPTQFVLKCTHDSGSTTIVKNKAKLNHKKMKRFYNKKLKQNHYWKSREYNYKNIKPRIIAEEMIIDDDHTTLLDYKFFCFNGDSKIIQVNVDRFGNGRRNYYDLSWNLLDLKIGQENFEDYKIQEPKQLSKMIELANTLSKNIPHVRVDFYNVGSKVYFGEMTFRHAGAREVITPYKWDIRMGSWINISEKYKTK